MVINNGVIL
ncbi:unnamed protein product [Candida parapsilosis]